PDIKVRDFPPAVLAALRQANNELLQEQAASDPLAKEIIDSQQAYLSKVRDWTRISTQAYLNTNP
ncbi:ABC transporter substrate-binding protein, partial [Vibrio cholerae]